MANRAFFDPAASTAPQRYRLTVVNTETGGQLRMSYSAPAPDCAAGQTPPSPHSNGRRCFPRGTGSGQTWWHKYLLTQVVERDLVGGSPDVVHSYTLSNTGASTSVKWAFAGGAAVWGASLGNRTWSEWRGWPRVTVTTGTGTLRTQHDYLYFRGLLGDRADPSGATRSSTVDDDIFGSTFSDSAWRAGQLFQMRTFDVAGGTPVELVRWAPIQINTGSRTVSSVWPTTFRSYITRHSQERSWEWNPDTASWAISDYANYTWDDLGREVSAQDEVRGTCTRTTYSDNTSKRLLESVSREQTARGTCADAPAIPADLLSDEPYSYDGLAFGAAPTKGKLTKTEVYAGGDAGWFVESTAGYDGYGRPATGADGLGRTTTIAYTHTADGRLSGTTVTNPAGHVTTTVLEPRRGLPTSATDANGKTTTAGYDPAGRLTKMWAPGRPTSGPPTAEYVYSLSKTSPSFVWSRLLGPNGNLIPSYQVYDGMLRLRQTQQTAPDGKRVIADTTYDARGLQEKATTLNNSASGPSSTLVSFAEADVDRQVQRSYDGQERQTAERQRSHGLVLVETVTLYGFRTVVTVPPQGGTVTRALYDQRGNVVAQRQYHTSDPNGTYDQSTYGYDQLDRQTTMTDPGGATWTQTYDLAGGSCPQGIRIAERPQWCTTTPASSSRPLTRAWRSCNTGTTRWAGLP